MSAFNAWYYSFSPVLAGVISDSPSMRIAVRAFLYPLLGILRTATAVFGVLSFNSEVGIVAAGLVASGLLGLFYDAPLLTAILIKLRRRYASSLRLRYLMPIHLSMFVSLVLILTAEILQNSVLMRFSTVTLVLSTMIGVAASVSFLCVNKVGRHLKLRE